MASKTYQQNTRIIFSSKTRVRPNLVPNTPSEALDAISNHVENFDVRDGTFKCFVDGVDMTVTLRDRVAEHDNATESPETDYDWR